MTTVQVCDRWELPLLDGSGGHYRYLDTASKRNAQCFLELVDESNEGGRLQIASAVEYFGGVGIFSIIIQRLFEPQWHWVFELDSDCIAQLSTIPNLIVAQGDAHETMGTIQADLVVCDFPTSTLRTLDEWPWERVVARHPRYIVVSDTAFRRLGLHRETYSKFAGEPVVSFEDYCRVYSKFMWVNYGYSVTHVRHHVYAYMLLQLQEPSDIEIVKVTPTRGLSMEESAPGTGTGSPSSNPSPGTSNPGPPAGSPGTSSPGTSPGTSSPPPSSPHPPVKP